MDKLTPRPCPFCGEADKVHVISGNHRAGNHDFVWCIWVECDSCFTQGPVVGNDEHYETQQEDLDRAIDAWNKGAKWLN
jgi:hypothetical protein